MEHERNSPGSETFTPYIESLTETEPIQPNQRQQDKILRYLQDGDVNVLGQQEAALSPEERQSSLQAIAAGEVRPEQFHGLLTSIQAPADKITGFDDLAQLYNQVAIDRQQRGILAQFSRGEFAQRNSVEPADLANFLQQYPDPMTFDTAAAGFLEQVELQNSPQKRAEYEESLREFERTVYGKRQQYWEQIQLLKEQAASLEPLPYDAAEQPERELSRLDPEKAAQLLKSTEIHGNRYRNDKLTPEILEHYGLGPQYPVELEGLNMYFSDPYSLQGSRQAVVGYTETPDQRVVARTYYLSQSQGMWRYLPAYSESGWFDKGHSEDSLNLPIEAQAALGHLSAQPPKQIEDSELVFFGTARNQGLTYHAETERSPQILDGRFYSDRSRGNVTPPEQLKFDNPDQSPDFSRPKRSWKSFSPVYGELTMEAYASRDQKYKYIMSRDSEDRAWVAAVENQSPVMSTGVRSHWTSGGDLVMPLYEYREQSGGYGSPTDNRGSYTQMWDNYLSKTPVIQDYLKSQRKA